MRRPWPAAALAAALTTTGITAAVAMPEGADAAAGSGALPAFNDCTELGDRMRELTSQYVTPYGFDYAMARRAAGGGWTREGRRPPQAERATAAKAAKAAAGEAAGAGGYSDKTVAASKAIDKAGVTVDSSGAVGPGGTGTNLQERGVDEPDIAKTDGRALVSLAGDGLRLFDVSGAKPAARGSLDLGRLHPTELLLAGDRVLVVGRWDGPASGWNRQYRLGLALVDIADLAHPKLLERRVFTGEYVSSRLVDGTARVVLSSSPYLVFRGQGYGESFEAAAARNRKVVQRAKVENWLGSYRVVAPDGGVGPARPLGTCRSVRHPDADAGFDMLNVLTLDLKDRHLDPAVTAVLASGDLVYASTRRLYVATTDGYWRFHQKGRASRGGTTGVHAFDLTGRGRTPYVASGSVPGRLLGRWALSEYGGDLRVVSTTVERSGRSSSGVTVLREKGDRLARVGKVWGIGKGEQVYAVRWFDRLAAVVTFRQIDPLHLVDLGDPAHPRLRGELKAPGYSQYMHPVGAGRLLGIGQAPAGGRGEWSLQVSAFDISDPGHPDQTSALRYGRSGASSIVQRDPRHFLFLPDAGAPGAGKAVMPADVPGDFKCRDDMTCDPNGYFRGLVAFRIGADGKLRAAGSWRAQQASGGEWAGDEGGGWGLSEQLVKVLPLPGGRLAALDGRGLTLLDAATLSVKGFARYV